MEFCSDCGTKLVADKKNLKQLSCPRCGKKKELKQKIIKLGQNHKSKESIIVVDNKQNLLTTPTKNIECIKCKNNLAQVWQVQTRSGDEGSTQFYRCTKCGFTWRLYT